MNMKHAVGLAMIGILALACTGEPKRGAELEAAHEQPAAGPRTTTGEQPRGDEQQQGGGEQPAAGGQQAAGPVPWLQPPASCKPQTTTIYVSGIILDLTSGEASCSRQIVVCGDEMRSDRKYNYKQGGKCPWAEGTTITQRMDGGAVCCDEWKSAKLAKTPCDPLADADCDGIPNDDDVEPMTAGAPGPG
jgi:hypothetical protein